MQPIFQQIRICIIELTHANLSILKTGKAKAIRFSTPEAIWKCRNASPTIYLNTQNSKQRNQLCNQHGLSSIKFLFCTKFIPAQN